MYTFPPLSFITSHGIYRVVSFILSLLENDDTESSKRSVKLLSLIHRAAMGRSRFIFHTRFIFSFLGDQSVKHPLGQTLNHATYDVYTPKTAETLIYGKCDGYCFFFHCV